MEIIEVKKNVKFDKEHSNEQAQYSKKENQ